MSFPTPSFDHLGAFLRGNASLISGTAFVSLAALASGFSRNLALAIYLLSFWHYYHYWLAYCFGSVPLDVFKRDAIAMKTVSLIALASVYLAAPPNLLSLAFVASGFLLNGAAAKALGSDRTYYGHEVANMPMRHITAFPYSWISHPMLLGNIAAFGGTMINAEFRAQWWPLACAHVALNLGLLVMETSVKPRRRCARALPGSTLAGFCAAAAAGALLGAVVGSSTARDGHILLGAVLGAGSFAHAFVIFSTYSQAKIPFSQQRQTESWEPR